MEKFAIVEEHFEYNGRDCIVVFNRIGFRCGYVSVNEKDKGFEIIEKNFLGKKYTELNYSAFNIDCHGGLTFGNEIYTGYEPKEKYYVGFDCGHCWDGVDKKQAEKYGFDTRFYLNLNEPVRSKEYCINECKSIVNQLNIKRN